MPEIKLPPYDLDAEEAVLGSMLLDSGCFNSVHRILKPEDFYREKNRWVFEACVSLRENKKPLDQITVANELKGRRAEYDGKSYLEAVGGSAYLSHIIANTPTSIHAIHYAKIVARLSWKRKLITAGNAIAGMGYNIGEKSSESWLKAVQMLLDLAKPLEDKPPTPTPIEQVKEAVKRYPPERQETKKQFKGGVQI